MNAATAALALVVSAMYLLIAIVVVPQLARVAMRGARSVPIVLAAGGAGTFFMGCAVSHVVIAHHELDDHDMDVTGGIGTLLGHVLPHLAQIVGGVTFIVLARRHLDVRILRRDDVARVEELEGRLRHALNAGRLGAWGVDFGTGARWHSSQHDRIFGYEQPPEAWNLDTMLDHVEPSQRDMVRDRLALSDEKPEVDVECAIVWPDGSTHWITITGALMFDELGEPLRMIGTVGDITERRARDQERSALEQQLHHWQRVEAVGRVASGVAHDFNNVLTAVNGWAELITLATDDDDVIGRHARAITAATDHGRALTNQLLTIGRDQAPATPLVDVASVVRSTVSMLQRLVPGTIEIHADLDAVAAIRIDPTHLSQILLNLAINARDAMPTGGRMTITTRHGDDEDGDERGRRAVVITVGDTGNGIDPDTLDHLFEPYFTTKPPHSGTGLGLSIVETLVERAHGTIAVQSTLGRGSTFTLTFPAAVDPATEVI